MNTRTSVCVMALLSLAAPLAAQDMTDPTKTGPTKLPEARALPTGDLKTVPYDQLISVRALESYSEPDFVAAAVAAGKLPPVADRLPAKPLVLDMSVTPDGTGVYGSVLRHVTGGRPEGWNWNAGLHQGWGGMTMTTQECLVSTGPMWQLSQDKIEPLPNLATSWEWSEDGHQLTMHLLEGAKWSDGDPFDAEDVMFFWQDNVLDPQVPARVTGDTFGAGTQLEKLDNYTIRFTFTDAFPVPNIYKMAYINFCPGPSHILKKHHPKYADGASYADYGQALPASDVPWVTMGAWAVTQYAPDQYVVARRNPYYWKVDQDGNQLPYLNEVQWRLSTWEDRDIQTFAGNADWTNMENPSIYLEGIRKTQGDDATNAIYWGPRSMHWRLDLNLSKTCGPDDSHTQTIRDLNRDLRFRRAVSQAIDRDALGQSLVRGPLTRPFAGGINTESGVLNETAIAYYPYAPETTAALLADLGFADTDGDGLLDWTEGPLAGNTLEIELAYSTQRTTDAALADSVMTMLAEAGIRALPRPVPTLLDPVRDSCDWDMALDRGDRGYQVPIGNLDYFAPVAHNVPAWHRGTPNAPQIRLDFEDDLAALVDQLRVETNSEKRVALFSDLNRIMTENVYHVGLINASAALIVNKRIRNIVPGTPVLMYQWSEKGAMRERLWIRPEDQGAVPEIQPGVIPGVD
ncbi:ABC transporter substrate-binding protein [Marinovum sp. 2_MG-2023]|uniref:ABC transporter substrate-binding protein n=1 Tax=unclassified Marinovum TaxID=2647166 RepID=UPI0026E3075A|nr:MULTISPECIES: ABC transporter substrate-binding protein [unclassified Marinovum]MDO6732259.1 ABC transporter substrate-binding protein [Marinovum sp. 2_MG-2023]MDO6781576.1 ABC transporter substrate-binding protein [Marinovum sp. 1_MG-2023]